MTINTLFVVRYCVQIQRCIQVAPGVHTEEADASELGAPSLLRVSSITLSLLSLVVLLLPFICVL